MRDQTPSPPPPPPAPATTPTPPPIPAAETGGEGLALEQLDGVAGGARSANRAGS